MDLDKVQPAFLGLEDLGVYSSSIDAVVLLDCTLDHFAFLALPFGLWSFEAFVNRFDLEVVVLS